MQFTDPFAVFLLHSSLNMVEIAVLSIAVLNASLGHSQRLVSVAHQVVPSTELSWVDLAVPNNVYTHNIF